MFGAIKKNPIEYLSVYYNSATACVHVYQGLYVDVGTAQLSQRIRRKVKCQEHVAITMKKLRLDTETMDEGHTHWQTLEKSCVTALLAGKMGK